jgi:uncharacterized protein (DUF736 family)
VRVTRFPPSLLVTAVGPTKTTWPLWLDLAKGRLRLNRLCRNGSGETFFPWASPIPREARKSLRRHPPPRSGPKTGASSIAFGLQIAIEAAMVAGFEQQRRSDMASIGTFKKSGHEFQGEIVTLSVQAKGVRIVPETSRVSDNAPSHRVYVGRAEIGAAWSKRSSEGRDYLSVKLDDPSFTVPIYANLVEDDGESFNLIWSRSRKQNGD